MGRRTWALPGRPQAAQISLVGDLAVTDGVCGADLTTGRLPGAPDAEFAQAFRNLDRLLRLAGLSAADVVQLTVQIPRRALRAYIDPPWLVMYPDAQRPARKTNEGPLPAGQSVQLQAIAVRGRPIRSLEIPGLAHRAPLPMGAAAGSLVFSSVIGGEDPRDNALPADPAAQIEQAFENAAELMRQAGGDASGINHLWAFAPDHHRSRLMVDAFLKRFPETGDRPARKTIVTPMPEGLHIQLQISGDTSGRRGAFEVDGVSHHDPIPLASRAGPLLQSSGVYGVDPRTSRLVAGGLEAETEATLGTLHRLMVAAGGGLDDIAGLTLMVRDFADAPAVLAHLAQLFPGGGPATRVLAHGLPDDLAMQLHVTAWLDR